VEKLIFFSLRMALFLLIANILMLFIVDVNSAEWVVCIISAVLMALLVAGVTVVRKVREKKQTDEKGAKEDE